MDPLSTASCLYPTFISKEALTENVYLALMGSAAPLYTDNLCSSAWDVHQITHALLHPVLHWFCDILGLLCPQN